MTAILFVIIGVSFLILVHEWGHFLAARLFHLIVEEFGFGFPPRIFAKKVGETRYSFNAIPLGGYVKIYGENIGTNDHIQQPSRSFAYQKAWKRATVIVAGVVMNFIFGWLIVSAVFFVGSPKSAIVEMVNEGSPAAFAGLQKGDQILGYESLSELISYIDINKGKEIILDVRRGREELEVKVVPRVDPPPGEGALGIGLQEAGIEPHGFFESLGRGLTTSFAIIGAILAGLSHIVVAPQNIVGPVGIVDMALTTGQLGIVYLLRFLGLLSLNLVVLNILPIPALDGGRLLFIIIEKIRGKRFSPKTEMKANAIGFSFLIALILLITFKDIAGLL